MADTDLVRESVDCFVDAWTLFARRFPGGRVEQLDGATATFAGVPLPFLNVSFVDSPCTDVADLAGRLRSVTDHGQGTGVPWMACLCLEWVPDDWRTALAEVGLYESMVLTGMVTESLEPPRRPAPALALRRVTSATDRQAVADLNNMAYGLPDGLCDSVAEAGFWPAEQHGYLGTLDGEDVTTTTVFPALGTAYVALVATHPDHGRRGYAEHVMRHAVEQARADLGLERTLLHASEAGRPVYAAMGYAETARFVLLTDTPPEEH